ncbi:VP2 [Chicken proventriculitis-associated circular virus 19]|nr:VP2 [Chicken proventriculitis-associated circular virus 19]
MALRTEKKERSVAHPYRKYWLAATLNYSLGRVIQSEELPSLKEVIAHLEQNKAWPKGMNWLISHEKGTQTERDHFHLCIQGSQIGIEHVYERLTPKFTFAHKGIAWTPHFGDKDGKHEGSWRFWAAYIIKDKDFIHSDKFPIHMAKNEPKGKKPCKDDLFREIIEESEDQDQFFGNMEKKAPETLIKSFNSVSAYAAHRFATKDDFVPFARETFTYPQKLLEWEEKFVKAPSTARRPILILHGESQLGKTNMARSLGPHSYHKNMFSLEHYVKDLKNGAKYVVLDDFSSFEALDFKLGTTIPNLKPFTDRMSFQSTDKYCRKMLVRPLPLILCTNHLPGDHMDSYWQVNSMIITVETPCYRKSPIGSPSLSGGFLKATSDNAFSDSEGEEPPIKEGKKEKDEKRIEEIFDFEDVDFSGYNYSDEVCSD